MAKKHRKFADDGWAIWVDGDDTSTVYINDWLNPKGKSYVDIAIRIRGVKNVKYLNVYVPFAVAEDEIEDVSLLFQDTKILQATFSTACIIDYKKNAHTSEIAYNGKTVDIVHISTLEHETKLLSEGTLISTDLERLRPFLDNDEAYLVWRMPHKSLDDIFKHHVDVGNVLDRLRDLITTPVVSEKYGYSIRINESRLLPEEINRIGAFHRQKLKKAVITISISETYDLNDEGCYRIRHFEEDLYKDYIPDQYDTDDVISYEWCQNRESNLQEQFNFYYNIAKNSVSRGSMIVYLILITAISCLGSFFANVITHYMGW